MREVLVDVDDNLNRSSRMETCTRNNFGVLQRRGSDESLRIPVEDDVLKCSKELPLSREYCESCEDYI